MKKIFLVIIILLPFLGIGQSSEDVNPIRLGVKGGVPIGIGVELEYVTPLLGNRIAPFVSYGMFPFDDFNFNYFEIGSNVYFGRKGKGGYVSASYGDLNGEVINLSGTNDNGDYYTNGVTKEQLSSFNLKLGWKYGKALYFKWEIGYAFGKLPEEIKVVGDVNGQQETFYLNYEEIMDYISGKGYPILNIGIGYGF